MAVQVWSWSALGHKMMKLWNLKIRNWFCFLSLWAAKEKRKCERNVRSVVEYSIYKYPIIQVKKLKKINWLSLIQVILSLSVLLFLISLLSEVYLSHSSSQRVVKMTTCLSLCLLHSKLNLITCVISWHIGILILKPAVCKLQLKEFFFRSIPAFPWRVSCQKASVCDALCLTSSLFPSLRR